MDPSVSRPEDGDGAASARIHVRYFAQLSEQLACRQEWIMLPSQVRTAGQLRAYLCARGDVFAAALAPDRAVRVAVDQVMAGEDTELSNGAEVAFFPPVTGG